MNEFEPTTRRRIPAIYKWGEIARADELMAYGPVFAELQQLVAGYVEPILKGPPPSDLPIEQPKRFEVVINLKTARALGTTIPTALLARAFRGGSLRPLPRSAATAEERAITVAGSTGPAPFNSCW